MLGLAIAASAQSTIQQRFDLALNFDGSPQSATINGFNPALGTLTAVRIRTFVRAAAELKVENTSDMMAVGRARFTGGVNLQIGLITPIYLHYTGFETKGREMILSAFDGTEDGMGTSGRTPSFTASQGNMTQLTDPTLLALISASPTVTIDATLGHQLGWTYFNGQSDRPWPSMELTGSGPTSVVVTYVYLLP